MKLLSIADLIKLKKIFQNSPAFLNVSFISFLFSESKYMVNVGILSSGPYTYRCQYVERRKFPDIYRAQNRRPNSFSLKL